MEEGSQDKLYAQYSMYIVIERKRLRRLLNNRVITIRGIVNPQTLGFPVVATVGLNVDLRRLRGIAKELMSHNQINFAATCTGIFDIIATGLFRSNKDLNDTLRSFIYSIEGVKETQTFISLEDEKAKIPWFVPRVVPQL